MSANQAVKGSGMESCCFGAAAAATVIVQMTQGGKHRLLTTDTPLRKCYSLGKVSNGRC